VCLLCSVALWLPSPCHVAHVRKCVWVVFSTVVAAGDLMMMMMMMMDVVGVAHLFAWCC
jgi:hypothetical protein